MFRLLIQETELSVLKETYNTSTLEVSMSLLEHRFRKFEYHNILQTQIIDTDTSPTIFRDYSEPIILSHFTKSLGVNKIAERDIQLKLAEARPFKNGNLIPSKKAHVKNSNRTLLPKKHEQSTENDFSHRIRFCSSRLANNSKKKNQAF